MGFCPCRLEQSVQTLQKAVGESGRKPPENRRLLFPERSSQLQQVETVCRHCGVGKMFPNSRGIATERSQEKCRTELGSAFWVFRKSGNRFRVSFGRVGGMKTPRLENRPMNP
jgi:hypothetical protein